MLRRVWGALSLSCLSTLFSPTNQPGFPIPPHPKASSTEPLSTRVQPCDQSPQKNRASAPEERLMATIRATSPNTPKPVILSEARRALCDVRSRRACPELVEGTPTPSISHNLRNLSATDSFAFAFGSEIGPGFRPDITSPPRNRASAPEGPAGIPYTTTPKGVLNSSLKYTASAV
jgi:hypothetical protein